MPKLRSWGVAILGHLLIWTSLYQIFVLLSAGYSYYSYLHQEYSPAVIFLRYVVSWIIKIAGLIAGVGILKLNEAARIFAIFNSLFIVLTVHLKHSYAAYSLHMKGLDQSLGVIHPAMSFSSLTGLALFIQRAIDVVFGLVLIYFFTRPAVKKQFKPEELNRDAR